MRGVVIVHPQAQGQRRPGQRPEGRPPGQRPLLCHCHTSTPDRLARVDLGDVGALVFGRATVPATRIDAFR